MQTPDVSVVVPVFNEERYLQECLDSILRQSLGSIEVICVDDASTDASVEILMKCVRADSRVRLIRNASNLGPGASRNRGIEAAVGRYLQFTDADDLLPVTALETLHARIDSDGVEIVRGMLASFSGDSTERLHVENPVEDRRSIGALEFEEFWIPWWHPCFMMSRSFILREGVRFPDLIVGEDPVFVASALVKAAHVSAVAQVTYYYRKHPFSERSRASFEHFESYFLHAVLVRDIYLAHKPECWTRGYGPFIASDLRQLLQLCAATDEQRREAGARIDEFCP
jgi:glycosyltransferase involved in cell wall biosynthesis